MANFAERKARGASEIEQTRDYGTRDTMYVVHTIL